MSDHKSSEGELKTPRAGIRNILVTSALPYVNNVPHLGNIIGCVLSADVYARFCRLRGYNVLYICGTDEYGTATETKALAEGLTPKQICDKYHSIHKQCYEWFGISFDHFGRTSTPVQTQIAQDIFKHCEANNKVLEEEVEQLYCETDSRFLADRYVTGTCPDCGYEDARGDQCDKCGHLLNATDLIDAKCHICKNTPIIKKSKHLFLDLPTLADDLKEFIDTQSEKGKWSSNSVSVSKSWLATGLKPRCITRDLKWGTPVPRPGYEDKVFYVWFDAPIGYISITAAYTKDWEKWWKANLPGSETVQLYQFMGKDNIPFHTVIFPSTLLGAGKSEGYTLLHHISTTEYLNYETGKFSKSRGTGVFGDSVQESGIPVEVWRYYLLANRPENADTVFLWNDFQDKNNNELLKNTGNFINRALKFMKNEFKGVVGKVVLDSTDEKVIEDINAKLVEYVESLEDVKIKNGLKTAMAVSTIGNQYLQNNKPWDLVKDPQTRARAESVIAFAANLSLLVVTLLEPYIPSLTDKVLNQLNLDRSYLTLVDFKFKFVIPAAHVIGDPEPLFAKLDDATIKALRDKYGGSKEELEEKKDAGGDANFPLELVIGRVEKVENHPAADHLYVLEINLGSGPRQIVSGLVKYYKPAELEGRAVIVVNNLKASNFKGVKSHGMVLCGQEGEKMGILTVPSFNTELIGLKVLPKGFAFNNGKFSLVDSKKLKAAMKKLNLLVGDNQTVVSDKDVMEVTGKNLLITVDNVGKGATVC